MALLVLGGALAGCVAEEGPRGRQVEHGECGEVAFTITMTEEPACARPTPWDGCQDGRSDCWAPPPRPGPRPIPSCDEGSNATFSVMLLSCSYEPPLFETFAERELRACGLCDEVAVATWGERVFVATEEGLDVVSTWTHVSVPPPSVGAPAVAFVPDLRSPSVAVQGRDAWYAALGRMPVADRGLDALLVARWDGTSGWAAEETFPLGDLPAATPAERVLLVPTASGVVALLASSGRAWSIDVQTPLARPEPFAGPEMQVRLGRPALDPEGRALLPYAARHGLGGPWSLRFAVLADPWSAWSHHVGPEAVGGIAPGTTPSLDLGPAGELAMSWADGEGRVVRADSVDGGASWAAPEPWQRATGTPTSPRAAREDGPTTLAWSDQERVVLARARPDGGVGWHEMAFLTRGEPDLALRQGKAVVAWLAPDRGLVLALEGEEGARCDDTAHCASRYRY